MCPWWKLVKVDSQNQLSVALTLKWLSVCQAISQKKKTLKITAKSLDKVLFQTKQTDRSFFNPDHLPCPVVQPWGGGDLAQRPPPPCQVRLCFPLNSLETIHLCIIITKRPDTANIVHFLNTIFDGRIGRVPAGQSGGRRLYSVRANFLFVQPKVYLQ